MVTVSRKIKGRRVHGSGTTKAEAMHDIEENQRRNDPGKEVTEEELIEIAEEAKFECYIEDLAEYDAALSVLNDEDLANSYMRGDLDESYDKQTVRHLTRHINRMVPEKAKLLKVQLKAQRMKWS